MILAEGSSARHVWENMFGTPYVGVMSSPLYLFITVIYVKCSESLDVLRVLRFGFCSDIKSFKVEPYTNQSFNKTG